MHGRRRVKSREPAAMGAAGEAHRPEWGMGMDNKNSNIAAAMEEPARFARHDGMLFYQCELGPVYAVQEGRLYDTWRADSDLHHAGTERLSFIPPLAARFEIGDGPATADDLEPGMLTSELGASDEAIEQWATWCDEHAVDAPPPSGPRIQVPDRSIAA